MKFTEAFETLGYELANHQTDWSAEADHGVCITVWKCEIDRTSGMPAYELDLTGAEIGPDRWTKNIGQRKRVKHLARAWDEFDRRVDVVLLGGQPGHGYGSADPWNVALRGGQWIVNKLDRNTGEFRVAVEKVDDGR